MNGVLLAGAAVVDLVVVGLIAGGVSCLTFYGCEIGRRLIWHWHEADNLSAERWAEGIFCALVCFFPAGLLLAGWSEIFGSPPASGAVLRLLFALAFVAGVCFGWWNVRGNGAGGGSERPRRRLWSLLLCAA